MGDRVRVEHGAALRMYEALREANPHLPAPEFIAAGDLNLQFGRDQVSVLTMPVLVRIPQEWRPTDV